MSNRRKVPKGIEPRQYQGRTVFRVRYLTPAGVRRAEQFDTLDEAVDFKAHMRLLRRKGALGDLDAGREVLVDYVDRWWRVYAQPNLALNTRRAHASAWNVHLLPRLGNLELRQVTPAVVRDLRVALERDGVGAPQTRRTLAVLQSIFRLAVEDGKVATNPVAVVRKPTQRRERAIVPLAPITVERVRARLEQRDATLVSILAYAGLRPEEALALEWRHVRRETLLVEQRVIVGEVVSRTKNGTAYRTVDLLDPLRKDLAEYRLAIGRPADDAFVFPRPDGRPFSDHDWRNWRARVFQVAADAVRGRPSAAEVKRDPRLREQRDAIAATRPYDLRHSFASLMLHDGSVAIVDLARQLGHGTGVLLDTYGHVIAELRADERRPAATVILEARAKVAEADTPTRKAV